MYESEDSGFTLFGARICVNPDASFSDCNDEAPKETIDGHPGEEDAGKVDESSVVAEEESRTEDGAVEKGRERPEKIIPCPRCRSMDTKFCYFNNYNVNQPRHFCRNCQRYWTSGGAMRSVPVGAGRRKSKPSPPAIACEPEPDNSVINIVSTSTTTSVSSMMTSEPPGPRQQHVPHPAVYCYPAANYPWGFPGFYPGSAPLQFVTGPYWGCMPFWPGGAVPASSTTASSSSGPENALGKHGREEDKTLTVDEPKAGEVSAKRTHNNIRIQ